MPVKIRKISIKSCLVLVSAIVTLGSFISKIADITKATRAIANQISTYQTRNKIGNSQPLGLGIYKPFNMSLTDRTEKKAKQTNQTENQNIALRHENLILFIFDKIVL